MGVTGVHAQLPDSLSEMTVHFWTRNAGHRDLRHASARRSCSTDDFNCGHSAYQGPQQESVEKAVISQLQALSLKGLQYFPARLTFFSPLPKRGKGTIASFSRLLKRMTQLQTYHGYKLWRYVPNIPASAVFLGLFSAITTLHAWRMFRTRT